MLRGLVRVLLVVPMLGAAALIGPRWYTDQVYSDDIYWVSRPDIPTAPVAIVFGAGLRWDGTPTTVLRHRVHTAADLYFAGLVDYLLLSGDNRFVDYNEPRAMADYAISLGVPESALVLDYAGRRTYDTCLRAREIFGVTNALLVTQHYHLDRALFTCDTLGLAVAGVAADRSAYSSRAFRYWWVREFPATTLAMWEVFVLPPADVVLGDPQPILSDEVYQSQ